MIQSSHTCTICFECRVKADRRNEISAAHQKEFFCLPHSSDCNLLILLSYLCTDSTGCLSFFQDRLILGTLFCTHTERVLSELLCHTANVQLFAVWLFVELGNKTCFWISTKFFFDSAAGQTGQGWNNRALNTYTTHQPKKRLARFFLSNFNFQLETCLSFFLHRVDCCRGDKLRSL